MQVPFKHTFLPFMKKITIFICLILTLANCNSDDDNTPAPGLLQLSSIRVGTLDLKTNELIEQAPIDKGIVISFNLPLDVSTASAAVSISTSSTTINVNFDYLDSDKMMVITPILPLVNNTEYELRIGEILGVNGEKFPGSSYRFKTELGQLQIISATINGTNLLTNERITDIGRNFQIDLIFSEALEGDDSFENSVKIGALDLDFELSADEKILSILNKEQADDLRKYTLTIDQSLSKPEGFVFNGFQKEFYTQLDSTFKFPELSDEELLTKVQEQTFKYFWDFAHPLSGLARERNTSGNTVTIGGSGFGVMAILVGIERGFITREEGVDRLETIVNFLETADRFHGVWPHWMDGNTGKTIPFSANDDGADLVETAFMIQGLLTARQYLSSGNTQELEIMNKITTLWEEVEWNWFTQGGQDVLYWHWSPNFEWEINLPIRGWNESLIIYVLAASSPTYPISSEVYQNGWARNGDMINGRQFYNIDLPLGEDRGGPLFFSHYSFLGLDPRNLEDQYANYWEQNISHSLINRAYCISNPLNYVGYSSACWGLTASDGNSGYSAHSPNNDRGVITPTAAISALPYAPEESMEAIKHFYYLLGDKLWGEYGFYDAFNITENWYASSYLAIDQGPIILMIENHRTALLWNLFMLDTEVTDGLDKLGFTSY